MTKQASRCLPVTPVNAGARRTNSWRVAGMVIADDGLENRSGCLGGQDLWLSFGRGWIPHRLWRMLAAIEYLLRRIAWLSRPLCSPSWMPVERS